MGPDRAQGQGLESPWESLMGKELSKQGRLLQGGSASPQRRPSTGPQCLSTGTWGEGRSVQVTQAFGDNPASPPKTREKSRK